MSDDDELDRGDDDDHDQEGHGGKVHRLIVRAEKWLEGEETPLADPDETGFTSVILPPPD
jgi:hypothetical protein